MEEREKREREKVRERNKEKEGGKENLSTLCSTRYKKVGA